MGRHMRRRPVDMMSADMAASLDKHAIPLGRKRAQEFMRDHVHAMQTLTLTDLLAVAYAQGAHDMAQAVVTRRWTPPEELSCLVSPEGQLVFG